VSALTDSAARSLLETNPEKLDWFIAFQDLPMEHMSGKLHWLRYCRPGYRHVSAFRDDGGRVQVVQMLSHRLEVSTIPGLCVYDYARWHQQQHHDVRRVRRNLSGVKWRPRSLFPQSCVTVVALVTGIRLRWWTLTPYQLSRLV